MRKIIMLLLLVSITGFVGGLYLLNFYECGASVACYDLSTKASALFYGMGALSIVFLFLLALPTTFHPWKKFAIWFIPIAAVLFAFHDDKGSGFMDISLGSVEVFQLVSFCYVCVSLVIIATSLYKSKKKK